MVSSGLVSSDASAVTNTCSNYQTTVSDLSSVWKGPSFDNLLSQAEAFVSEYPNTIQKEMNAFASACELYQEYKTTKSLLEAAKSNYAAAIANKDEESASRYSAEISEYSAKLERLAQEINSCLEEAASGQLDSSGVSATSLGLSTSSATQSTTPGEFVVDKSKGIYGHIESSIDGKTHTVFNQFQIQGWRGDCNRAAAASIASAFVSNPEEAVEIAKQSSDGIGYDSEVTNAYFNQFGLTANVSSVQGSYDSIKNDIVSNLQDGKYVMFDLSQPLVVGKSGQLWAFRRHWVSVLDLKQTENGDYAIFISDSGHGASTKDHGMGAGWYSLDEFTGKNISNFTTISNNN